MNYKEMVANLEQARHTLKKLGFSPRTVTIGEFAEAMSNINETIDELNTARENGTE